MSCAHQIYIFNTFLEKMKIQKGVKSLDDWPKKLTVGYRLFAKLSINYNIAPRVRFPGHFALQGFPIK